MKILMTASFFLGLLLAGCQPPDSSGTGRNYNALPELGGQECYLIFRRDALGYAMATEAGIGSETVESGISGKLALRGKLIRASADWVVLETSNKGIRVVPVSSILSIYEINEQTQ
jgi:hypothetical protein